MESSLEDNYNKLESIVYQLVKEENDDLDLELSMILIDKINTNQQEYYSNVINILVV